MEETIFLRKKNLVQKIYTNTINAIDPRNIISMLKRINILSPNYHFDVYNWKFNSTPKCNQIHLIFVNILVHIYWTLVQMLNGHIMHKFFFNFTFFHVSYYNSKLWQRNIRLKSTLLFELFSMHNFDCSKNKVD